MTDLTSLSWRIRFADPALALRVEPPSGVSPLRAAIRCAGHA